MKVNSPQAADLLLAGDVVALPTETVYGLAGCLNHEAALRKIFAVKARPFFDPLIVHIFDLHQARELTSDFSLAVEVLAKAFWPGPLTLVLPKTDRVSTLITAGLPTVGLRMPRHSLTLDLLKDIGVPVAAPSANRFGRTSPTTADHVESEFSGQVAVLDGGPCDVGLESTIISLQSEHGKVHLQCLRQGQVRISQIEETLKRAGLEPVWSQAQGLSAPGQMQHHYMPDLPLIVFQELPSDWMRAADQVTQELSRLPTEIEGVQIRRPQHIHKWGHLVLSADPTLAAREFYQRLREVAAQPIDAIAFVKPNHLQGEHWEALWNRLSKAATLIF